MLRSKSILIVFFAFMTSLVGNAVLVAPAHAATLIVSDCSAPDGASGRLMDMIAIASPGDTINFSCSGTIVLTNTIIISKNLTIDGAGQAITLSGNDSVRVISINSGVSLTLNTLTIYKGKDSDGSGIYNNNGSLIVNNSVISGNDGIGIRNDASYPELGPLTITNSIISGNNGTGISNSYGILSITNSTISGNSGGGINNSGELTVTNSTISGNSGGGILNAMYSSARVINSTISGHNASGITNLGPAAILTVLNSSISNNSATGYGGGIYSVDGSLLLSNSTISGNSASLGGGIYSARIYGGMSNLYGAMFYSNTIIANSISGGDCVIGGTGQIYSNSYNLVEDGSCGAFLSGDPNLGELADNGGPTFTHALVEGSIAIDIFGCQSTDQRGVPRPQGAGCDIGAYELDITAPIAAIEQAASQFDPANTSPVNFTATFNEPIDTSTFTSADVILSGTAGAITAGIAQIAPNNGTTFNIAVSGMTTNGTVIASIPSGGVQDIAKNFNTTNISNDHIITFYLNPSFADVPFNHWAWQYIEIIFDAGITGGCSTNPLNYCPTSSVTRAQMAVFLLKGIHGQAFTPPAVNGSTGFNDVAADYWAAAWIKQLAAEGITGGCGNGNYCPENTVTRDQMAVFLLKAKYGSSYAPPAVTDTGFTDVPADYWAAAWIKQLAVEAITGGCGGGLYCPSNPVTRDQMAVFLQKTFNLLLP